MDSDARALKKAKADDLATVAGDAANAHLLRQSGADSVITSSGAAGPLLGLAIETPQLVAVIEDLRSVGEGVGIIEQPVVGEQAGRRLSDFDQRKLALR